MEEYKAELILGNKFLVDGDVKVLNEVGGHGFGFRGLDLEWHHFTLKELMDKAQDSSFMVHVPASYHAPQFLRYMEDGKMHIISTGVE